MIYFPLFIHHMQNERDYTYQNNEFVHIQDFEKLFQNVDGALLVFEVLDNNVYLYEID